LIGKGFEDQRKLQEQTAEQIASVNARVGILEKKIDELAGNVEAVAEGMNLLLTELARALGVPLDDAPNAPAAAKSRKPRG